MFFTYNYSSFILKMKHIKFLFVLMCPPLRLKRTFGSNLSDFILQSKVTPEDCFLLVHSLYWILHCCPNIIPVLLQTVIIQHNLFFILLLNTFSYLKIHVFLENINYRICFKYITLCLHSMMNGKINSFFLEIMFLCVM